MSWKREGVKFDANVKLYNVENGDEIDIMELNEKLEEHTCGVGRLWIYPYYDDDYSSGRQNKYEIFENGDRSPSYMHEFLATAQVFTYHFTGVKIVSGILKKLIPDDVGSSVTSQYDVTIMW